MTAAAFDGVAFVTGAGSGIARQTALQLAAAGVRVNVIAPGPVDTPFFARGMEGETLDNVRTERAKSHPAWKDRQTGRSRAGGGVCAR